MHLVGKYLSIAAISNRMQNENYICYIWKARSLRSSWECLYMNKAWSESAKPPRMNANKTQLVVQIKLLEMLMVPSKETYEHVNPMSSRICMQYTS